MAGFLTGLVGSYGGIMLQKEKREHDEEMKNREARLRIITSAIESGKLTPDAEKAAWEQVDEITKGGKKGKGVGNFSDIMGRLTGHVQSGQPLPSLPGLDPGFSGGQTTRTLPNVNGDQPPSRPTTLPGTQGASASVETLPSQPPTRPPSDQPPTRSPFKTPDEIEAQKIKNEGAEAEADRARKKKWRAEDAEEAVNALNKAKTPEEREVVAAQYGVKLPQPHLQAATVTLPDGSVQPAAFDPQSGKYIDPASGLELAGARKYEKPTADTKKRDQTIADYLRTHPEATMDEAKDYAAKEALRQSEAKGQPQVSTSTTVESTPEGPAVTKQTTTVKGPAGAKISAPPVRGGGGGGGTAKSATTPLPWATPKEGRADIQKAWDASVAGSARSRSMVETNERIKKDPSFAGVGDYQMLVDFVGMTIGSTHGARITQAEWNQAKASRPWLESIGVSIEGGFVTGASLTQRQRDDMVSLGKQNERNLQKSFLDQNVHYGVMVTGTITSGKNAGQRGYMKKSELKDHPEFKPDN